MHIVSPKKLLPSQKNMNAIIHSFDRDRDFFDIVSWILQGATLAPFFDIICLDYVLQTSMDLMKGNGLTLKKRPEIDDTSLKPSRIQTSKMI